MATTKPAPKKIPWDTSDGKTAKTKVVSGPPIIPAPEVKKKKSTIKIPKKIGEVADLYYDIREKRRATDAEAAKLKAQESELQQYLIANLPKSKSTGVSGSKCRVTVEEKDVPTVKDWTKFYAYILKNKAFDMLQRRVSTEAIEARWDDGKVVPGVEKFGVKKLSVNKL